MESMSLIAISQKLKKGGVRFVDQRTLERFLGKTHANTTHKILLRLAKNGIIQRISQGKYLVSDLDPEDFEVANYAISPSYISFETALSYYGVLSQFTYSITSATPNKSKKLKFGQKELEYTKIDPKLYWGFNKTREFLIASPEKAAIDTIYMVAKGLRRIDVHEWDWTHIDKPKFKFYSKMVSFAPFQKFIKNMNLYD